MYSPRPIPESFRKTLEKTKEEHASVPSIPIMANEKAFCPNPAKQLTFPLGTLLFLNIFCKNKKGDE